ncbi:ABC transporter ATP-binding protein [uncultured Amnibacterium sp.]|uniref:ABC transporter ATP-binding protein n=1 Tax=uncultured Amnibacterium sp. TaxID=1631851 RepID=UPI0035CA0437
MYELAAVAKTYKQGAKTVHALTGVDLIIADGDFVAIQGPTGGGKSTLLQLLGALDRPSSGAVRLGDQDLGSLGATALSRIRAERIGFVFQSFNLIPTLTALENVETALAPIHVDAKERRARSREALEAIGLGDRTTHLPSELSGGQQQRVAIARALVKQPQVLLADEPTGALDEDTRGDIVGLLEAAWRDRGLTLVVVTHDSWVAARADRRLHLKQGKVTERTAVAV